MKIVLLLLLVCAIGFLNGGLYDDDYYMCGLSQSSLSLRNIRTEPTRRWPNGVVPLQFWEGYTTEQKNSIVQYINGTFFDLCVRIQERTTEEDYVFVTGNVTGCSANVGRIGGRQQLSLTIHCIKENSVHHEFMHTLGMGHMQSTRERDDYVTIFWENIKEGTEGNFNRKEELSMSPFPYDYNSLLHYPQYAFSKNGNKTIIAKGDPDKPLRPIKKLTDIDKAKVRHMYCA